jgi:hypothetical protein
VLIRQRLLHRPGQGAHIGGVHQKRRIPGHFGQAGGVGADHRRSAGHRFQHRQSEALIETGEDKEVGGTVDGREVLVGHVAGEDDPVPQPQFPQAAEEALVEPTFFAHNDQAQVVGRQEVVEGFQERGEVLAGLNGADVEDEVLRQAVAGADGSDGFWAGRAEAGVHPLVDDGDFLLRDAIEANGVPLGALGDGDDRIGRAQEAGHHQGQKPAVQGFVGFGMEEEDEVVEGEDRPDRGKRGSKCSVAWNKSTPAKNLSILRPRSGGGRSSGASGRLPTEPRTWARHPGVQVEVQAGGGRSGTHSTKSPRLSVSVVWPVPGRRTPVPPSGGQRGEVQADVHRGLPPWKRRTHCKTRYPLNRIQTTPAFHAP